MTTGTDAVNVQAVSRETLALMPVPPEGEASTPVDTSARAEALSWAPNTRKAYVVGWNDFTSWCSEDRCPGLSVAPSFVGSYLEDLVEVRGMALTKGRNRLAAIAAAHRLGKHLDPVEDPW